MADNLETRVDQLTSAIRGLYDKPTATVNDINNAINSVMNRFDGSSTATTEQLGQVLLNNIRTMLEEKQNYVQEHLAGFENVLRQIASNSTDAKLNTEISRLMAEVSSVYTKIGNNETLLNNISRALENDSSRSELEKLKNEIAIFSRGFENITQTLNKNFNEFLLQMQTYSSKEDFKKLFLDIDSVSNNTNAIISALAIIDHKYKDLTGLIDLVAKKESAFADGLSELSRNVKVVEGLSNVIHNTSSKDDLLYVGEKIIALQTFLDNLKSYIETTDVVNKTKLNEVAGSIDAKLTAIQNADNINKVKEEIRATYIELKENSHYLKDEMTTHFKTALLTLEANTDFIKENFVQQSTVLNKNLEALSGEVSRLQDFVSKGVDTKTDEIRTDIKGLLADFESVKANIESAPSISKVGEDLSRANDENFIKMYDLIHEQLVNLDSSIEIKTASNKIEIAGTIAVLQADVKSLLTGLINLKNDMGEATKQSMEVLKEPIQKALSNIENLTIGNELKQLSVAVEQIVSDIKKSFETMKDNFAQVATNSNIEVLQQLNSSIPSIIDKLEIFRSHVVSENAVHIQDLKKHFNEALDSIKASVESITTDVKIDFNKMNDEISQVIKMDMQKLSDHIIESVEGVNLSISQEFNDHKVNIDELLVRVQDYESRFKDKLDSIEATFETLNQDTCDRMADAINENNIQYQSAINSVKNDILTHVSGMGEQSRAAFAEISVKLEKFLAENARSNLTSISPEDKNASLASIESKMDRANLQQIHNAKELMDEIQNINAELAFKIDNVLGMDESGNVSKFMAKLEDKIQTLLDNGRDIDELARITKNHIDQRIKELIAKIPKQNEIRSVKSSKDDASVEDEIISNSKINEIISGLEYVQNNLFNEMRESFAKQNDVLNDIKEPVNVDKLVKNVEEALVDTLKKSINTKDIAEELKKSVNTEEIAEKIKDAINPDKLISKIKSAIDADVIIEKISDGLDSKEIAKAVKDSINTDYLAKKLKTNISTEEIIDSLKTAFNADVIAHKVQEAFDVDEIVRKVKYSINTTELLEELKDIVLSHEKDSVQNAQELNRTIEDKVGGLETLIKSLNEGVEKIQKTEANDKKYTYTMEDVESDLAKMRLSVEKSNNDVRARIAAIQKAGSLNGEAGKIGELLSKKFGAQEERLENIESKVTAVIQKQNEEFDIKSFIDVFYENTTQTKSLASRVETMESQLNVIARHMQKIISYIEE